MLFKLDDELRDTYSMKKTDTYQMYYEALKTLNPFIYETLSYFKEIVGDYFIEFQIHHMDLQGIAIHTTGLGGTHGGVEHIASSDQLLGARHIQHHA